MIIIICSDHGGFKLKEYLKLYLMKNKKKYDVTNIIDTGTYYEDRCDYPDIFNNFYLKYMDNKTEGTFGILVCGIGIGMSIIANRMEIIRCALCHNEYTAEMARKHNNANVLALGGRVLKPKKAKNIVKKFLRTNFEGGRHIQRIEKIEVWFAKYGYWVIFANRFLSGTRSVISLFAGIFKLNGSNKITAGITHSFSDEKNPAHYYSEMGF